MLFSNFNWRKNVTLSENLYSLEISVFSIYVYRENIHFEIRFSSKYAKLSKQRNVKQ